MRWIEVKPKVKYWLHGLLVFWLTLMNFGSAAASTDYRAFAQNMMPRAAEPSGESTETADVIYVPGNNHLDLQTAIGLVRDGGVIEMAAGIYAAPAGGFSINRPGKSFVIRAAPNAEVILDGGGVNRVLDVRILPSDSPVSIVFKGITFANGYTQMDGVAAGVTLYHMQATFIDCVFRNNRKNDSPGHTVGGAVGIAQDSTVFFFNSLFENNYSENGGGGIGVRDSKLYIHNSRFVGNQAVSANLSLEPTGGAINAGNSIVRITNSTLENNQASMHGGAIWVIGNWDNPSGSDVIIANAYFRANQALQHYTSYEARAEGGAITVEDQVRMRVYHSRFVQNKGMIGGAMSLFRAKVEIYGSVFQGNQATDNLPTSGFGGAIAFNYYDRPDYANLIIEDTLIQGRFGGINAVAQFGGGLHIIGESVSTVRPSVALRRLIFYDCDVYSAGPKSGTAGAIGVYGANLTLEDSLVLDSDAYGAAGGIGGGVVVYDNTQATIRRTTFARNTAVTFGGAVFAQGAEINISDSNFIENEISPGVQESLTQSYGAAIFTTPWDPDQIPSSADDRPSVGWITNNLFIRNIGIAIFDDDRSSGPINDVRYDGNQFFPDASFGNLVYWDNLAPAQTGSGLNNLIVRRTNGTLTDKSPSNNNLELISEPSMGVILAAPSVILPLTARGESETTTRAFLGYAWSGDSASLKDTALSTTSGLIAVAEEGAYNLMVSGNMSTAIVTKGVIPSVSVTSTPLDDNTMRLDWETQAGAWLDTAMDGGVIIPAARAGSAVVNNTPLGYYLYVVTEEGGAVVGLLGATSSLSIPNEVIKIIGLNRPEENFGYIYMVNLGNAPLNWTASTRSPDLLSLEPIYGVLETTSWVRYDVNLDGLSNGDYQGIVDIDAGPAGRSTVIVKVLVMDPLEQLFVPAVIR